MTNLAIQGIEAPLFRTDTSIMEFIQALIAAWFLNFGKAPTRRQIAILYAHYALEHGSSVSMHNHNVGGLLRVYGAGKHPYYILPFDNSPLFLSFESLLEGTKSYLFYLKKKKFPLAWKGIENENLVQFVSLLKRESYFSASHGEYLRAMMSYFGRFMSSGLYEQAGSILDAFEVPKPVEQKWYEKLIDWFRRIFLF